MEESSTLSYFQSRANRYSRLAQLGLWNYVKQRERRQLFDLVPTVLPENGDILELGSGAGFYTERLQTLPHRRLTCVDFSSRMLESLSIPCDKVLADIESLPEYVRQRSYSLIVCAGAMEFVRDPQRLLSDLFHMQVRGGALIFFMPRRSLAALGYSWFHRFHGVRIRRYQAYEIESMTFGTGYTTAAIRDIPPFNYGIKLIRT